MRDQELQNKQFKRKLRDECLQDSVGRGDRVRAERERKDREDADERR